MPRRASSTLARILSTKARQEDTHLPPKTEDERIKGADGADRRGVEVFEQRIDDCNALVGGTNHEPDHGVIDIRGRTSAKEGNQVSPGYSFGQSTGIKVCTRLITVSPNPR